MRLSAFAVVAASAAFTHVIPAHVSAAPIRLLVVTSSVEEDSPLSGIRFGHAVQPMPPYRKDDGYRELLDLSHPPPPGFPAPPTHIPDFPLPGKERHIPPGNSPKRFRHRPGCHGKKGKIAIFMHGIKIKAIKIGNCFRKALGWPLIDVKHRHHHHYHHGHPRRPPNGGKDEKKDEQAGRIWVDGGFVNILPFHGGTADNHRDYMSHDRPHDESELEQKHHKHHGAFLSRLHHSLMNLGRWEGRAVAFVIGCGIGVLIRMFWVLAIVSYRACRGYRDDGYVTVTVMEEYDSDYETVISAPSPKTGPPRYIYPVDEKIAIEESN